MGLAVLDSVGRELRSRGVGQESPRKSSRGPREDACVARRQRLCEVQAFTLWELP